jgi:hypothetical protein
LPDVALPRGAENRVGQRVEKRVSVRMALETVRMGNLHPAQEKRTVGNEPVNVKSETDSHRRRIIAMRPWRARVGRP